MKNCGFTAFDGDAHIPYEFVIEDDKPIKLGDGTFGCVFQVRGRDQNAALKIFYESDDEFILNSQKLEMSIGSELRRYYVHDNSVSASINTYLVAPIASLNNFKETAAYKELCDYFESLSFEISCRAIVMDFYPMSLKDLLERGWPMAKAVGDKVAPNDEAGDAGVGRGAGGQFGDRSGYSLLRDLDFSKREACILPIAEDVAEALSILHRPNFHHQDIKPANVLVRQLGDYLRVAVADLGFIDSGSRQVHGSIWQSRALGTRHYRSPEQTDFFDVCEVDISEDGGQYRLTTHDPKFMDTFSEPGDLVVFSKFSTPRQWEIERISFSDLRESRRFGTTKSSTDEHQNRTNVSSPRISILLKPLPKQKLEPDERTQITVNKKQTARTDLFGLGAIVYDMITCGKSPERFYDLLRAHDRPGESIERGLAQQYLHFRNGGSTVPEIDAVFQSLRIDSTADYPSSEIVKIILKCMMSRPKDSYYSDSRYSDVWTSVKSDLRKLSKDEFRRVNFNSLTCPSRPSSAGETPTAPPLKILQEIQSSSYSSRDKAARRLVRGVRYFKRVGEMITHELAGDQLQHYLVDVSPKSLRDVGGRFSSKFTLFETKDHFESMLSSGNPRSVLQALPAGTLLPPFMHTQSRDCEVWVGSDERDDVLHYDLWGSSDRWSDVRSGDRLNLPEILSGEIVPVGGGVLRLASQNDGALSDLLQWRKYRGTICRRFTPTDYYLAMLGIYVRTLFFVNPEDRREYTPRRILQSEQVDGFRLILSDQRRSGSVRRRGHRDHVKEVFRYLTELYVRLITRRGLDGYDSRGFSPDVDNGSEVVSAVVGECLNTVAELFEIDRNKLEYRGESALVKEIRDRVYPQRDFPDIEVLVEDVLKPAAK